MALEIPIQSARIIPLPSTLTWGQARVPGDILTVVNVSAPVDVQSYASRDFELAYRDVILAALTAEVAIDAADIFGMDATRATLQGIPSGDLRNSGADRASLAFPGTINHVIPANRPLDAIQVDRQLYTRDLLLYEALARAAKIFTVPPLPSIAPALALSDAWSLAEGSSKRASVSGNLPLKVDLFKLPDAELAQRDNQMAMVIAQLAYELGDMYARATRLLVQVTDPDGAREPEVYTLMSDDGENRVFIVSPGLSDRNRVVYSRTLRTVTWLGEYYDDLGTSSFCGRLNLNLGEASVNVQGAKSTRPDAYFFKQKSGRLRLNTYKANPLYWQPNPVEDVSLSAGAVYQPDGVYLPAPGSSVTFTPTISDGQAHYRLAIYFEPSRIARVFGSLNLNGVTADNSEDATLAGPGFLNWQIKLIEGRYTVRFRFADMDSPTDNFDVRLVWNGEPIFEGIILYGRDPGTFIFSNPFVLSADGEIGSFTIERVDNRTGKLTVGVVEFINVRDGNLSCKMTATMGARSSTAIFSSQSGRPDTLFFDFFDAIPGTVNLYLDDVNIGGLYLRVLDIRRFGAQRETPNAVGYRLWKRTFIGLALESVRRAYKETTAGLVTQPAFANATVWDINATESWMNSLEAAEPRLRQAFRVGRPGDVGQPALTPGGLFYDITNRIVRQLDMTDTFPNMQAFQPWMIAAGIYVFHQDFWIDDFDPTIQLAGPITECDFVTADFTAVADTPSS
jgi:hypothetical protein